ncbi:MAG: hypothetical protein NC097_08330 [Clostridium sp.]|nr:hypothetical protein [Clostridium sp.]
MKHFRQSVLKALFLLVMLLTVGQSSYAWDNYYFKDTSDNNAVKLEWNSSTHRYTGVLQGSKKKGYYKVVANTGSESRNYWASNSSDWYVNDSGGSCNLTDGNSDAKAFYINSDSSFIVEVKPKENNGTPAQGWDPVEVKFTKLNPTYYFKGTNKSNSWTWRKAFESVNNVLTFKTNDLYAGGGFGIGLFNEGNTPNENETDDTKRISWWTAADSNNKTISNTESKTFNLSSSGSNFVLPNEIKEGDYTFQLELSNGLPSKLTVIPPTVVTTPVYNTYQLFNGGSWIATINPNTEYTLDSSTDSREVYLKAFSVCDNNWSNETAFGPSSDITVTSGSAIALSGNSHKITIPAGKKYTYKFTISGSNNAPATITFTEEGSQGGNEGGDNQYTVASDIWIGGWVTVKGSDGIEKTCTWEVGSNGSINSGKLSSDAYNWKKDANGNYEPLEINGRNTNADSYFCFYVKKDNSYERWGDMGNKLEEKYFHVKKNNGSDSETQLKIEYGSQGPWYITFNKWNQGGNELEIKVSKTLTEPNRYTGWELVEDGGETIDLVWDANNNEYKAAKAISKNSNGNKYTIRVKDTKNSENTETWGAVSNGDYYVNGSVYDASLEKNGDNFLINTDSRLSVYVKTIGNVEGSTPRAISFVAPTVGDYYFAGDMNNWYSPKEFGVSSTVNNFDTEKENWKFTIINGDEDDFDTYPSDVQDKVKKGETWYILDFAKYARFHGNLSGQFQITTGKQYDGGSSFWDSEGYCSAHRVQEDGGQQVVNGNSNRKSEYKKYSENPIAMTDISSKQASKSLAGKMKQRNEVGKLYSNFHLDCNYVENAKIFFKPGKTGTCDMYIQGTPRHYYVFYCFNDNLDANNKGDNKVQAEIIAGKPNSNNYFLPGLVAKYNNKTDDGKMWKYEVSYDDQLNAKYNWGDDSNNLPQHMNYDGYDLVKVYDKVEWKNSDNGVNLTEANKVIKDYGVLEIFKTLANGDPANLPDGTSVAFDQIWIAKIPNGFENPAGMKYQLFLDNALDKRDKSTVKVDSDGKPMVDSNNYVEFEEGSNLPQTIANNHVYYFPSTSKDGVAVHINDEGMAEAEIEGHKYKDLDVKFYYRVYYVDSKYNTMVVVHDENGKHSGKQVYASDATKQNTVFEEGAALNEGWVEMESHEMHAPVYYSSWTHDEDQIPANLFGVKITSFSPWHVKWDKPESGDTYPSSKTEGAWSYDYRHKIDHAFRNSYVQIAMVSRIPKKEDVRTKAAPDNVNLENFTYEGFKDADYITFMPNALTTENTDQHYPLRGKDKYIVLDRSNGGNFTAVEDITDDFIFDVEEAEAAATPVYYNLQGVRVANPTKGIYIKVTGNKSEKVVF